MQFNFPFGFFYSSTWIQKSKKINIILKGDVRQIVFSVHKYLLEEWDAGKPKYRANTYQTVKVILATSTNFYTPAKENPRREEKMKLSKRG